jgi:hypothetical protein
MYNLSKSTWNPASVWTLVRPCCPDLSNECCRDVTFRTKDQAKNIFGPGSTFKNSAVNVLVQAVNRVSQNSHPLASGYPAIRGLFNGGSRVR